MNNTIRTTQAKNHNTKHIRLKTQYEKDTRLKTQD